MTDLTAASIQATIADALDVLGARVEAPISVGVVLGTGLGAAADVLTDEVRIDYAGIPGFGSCTVEGHDGVLHVGVIGSTNVAVMAGRHHFYEGYSTKEVTLPIRILHALGANTIILTNAAGSLNEDHAIGNLVILRDQINMLPDHPLRGLKDTELGPRFVPMNGAFDGTLREIAADATRRHGLTAHTGVYAGVQGPSIETPAAYGLLHHSGADVVGMSTVSEVIVARQLGMRVLGISVVTDLGYPPGRQTEIELDGVLDAARGTAPALGTVIADVVTEGSVPTSENSGG